MAANAAARVGHPVAMTFTVKGAGGAILQKRIAIKMWSDGKIVRALKSKGPLVPWTPSCPIGSGDDVSGVVGPFQNTNCLCGQPCRANESEFATANGIRKYRSIKCASGACNFAVQEFGPLSAFQELQERYSQMIDKVVDGAQQFDEQGAKLQEYSCHFFIPHVCTEGTYMTVLERSKDGTPQFVCQRSSGFAAKGHTCTPIDASECFLPDTPDVRSTLLYIGNPALGGLPETTAWCHMMAFKAQTPIGAFKTPDGTAPMACNAMVPWADFCTEVGKMLEKNRIQQTARAEMDD